MRNIPLKGLLGKSPIKKTYPTKDYSPEATKGNVGDKIAKAVTPSSKAELLPVGRAFKGAKAVYKYFMG